MATEAEPAPKKGKGLIFWILLAVFALASGAAVPWILASRPSEAPAPKKAEPQKSKLVAIPFDDVQVNLSDDRLNRFLRLKLLIAVEEPDTREVTELLTKQKPFLRSWLISHLSDQSSQEVSRRVGVNRLRREIRDQFNAMLFPAGEEKIADVLVDSFLVQ